LETPSPKYLAVQRHQSTVLNHFSGVQYKCNINLYSAALQCCPGVLNNVMYSKRKTVQFTVTLGTAMHFSANYCRDLINECDMTTCTGTVGYVGTRMFVWKIYSTVKID